jgi:hypothetical protein
VFTINTNSGSNHSHGELLLSSTAEHDDDDVAVSLLPQRGLLQYKHSTTTNTAAVDMSMTCSTAAGDSDHDCLDGANISDIDNDLNTDDDADDSDCGPRQNLRGSTSTEGLRRHPSKRRSFTTGTATASGSSAAAGVVRCATVGGMKDSSSRQQRRSVDEGCTTTSEVSPASGPNGCATAAAATTAAKAAAATAATATAAAVAGDRTPDRYRAGSSSASASPCTPRKSFITVRSKAAAAAEAEQQQQQLQQEAVLIGDTPAADLAADVATVEAADGSSAGASPAKRPSFGSKSPASPLRVKAFFVDMSSRYVMLLLLLVSPGASMRTHPTVCLHFCLSMPMNDNRFSQRRASTAQQQQQQQQAEGTTTTASGRPETFLEARSRFKSSNMQEGKNPIYRTDGTTSTSNTSSNSTNTATASTTSAAAGTGVAGTSVSGVSGTEGSSGARGSTGGACICTCDQRQLDRPLDRPLDKQQQQSLGGRPMLSVVTAAAASYNVSGSRSSLVSSTNIVAITISFTDKSRGLSNLQLQWLCWLLAGNRHCIVICSIVACTRHAVLRTPVW